VESTRSHRGRLDIAPFAWLISTWFSDLTDTWISTDPQTLELSENIQHYLAKVVLNVSLSLSLTTYMISVVGCHE